MSYGKAPPQSDAAGTKKGRARRDPRFNRVMSMLRPPDDSGGSDHSALARARRTSKTKRGLRERVARPVNTAYAVGGPIRRRFQVQPFRSLMRGDELIVAPFVFNPIMAKLAEESGFKAVYLGGGSLGWVKCVTEANLTLPEMTEIAVEISAN